MNFSHHRGGGIPAILSTYLHKTPTVLILGAIAIGFAAFVTRFESSIFENLNAQFALRQIVSCGRCSVDGRAANPSQAESRQIERLIGRGDIYGLAWAFPLDLGGNRNFLQKVTKISFAESEQPLLFWWKQFQALLTNEKKYDADTINLIYVRLLAAYYQDRASLNCKEKFKAIMYQSWLGIVNDADGIEEVWGCSTITNSQANALTILQSYVAFEGGDITLARNIIEEAGNRPDTTSVFLTLFPYIHARYGNAYDYIAEYWSQITPEFSESRWLAEIVTPEGDLPTRDTTPLADGVRELRAVYIDRGYAADAGPLPGLVVWKNQDVLQVDLRLLPNLVPNGGFEWGLNDLGLPEGWRYFVGYREEQKAYSVQTGQTGNCLALNSSVTQDERAGVESLPVFLGGQSHILVYGVDIYATGQEIRTARIGFYEKGNMMTLFSTPIPDDVTGDYYHQQFFQVRSQQISPYLIHWRGNTSICLDNVFLVRLQ